MIEITINFTRVMVKSPFWKDEITPTGLIGMDSRIASSLVNSNQSEGYKLDPIYLVISLTLCYNLQILNAK